MGLVLSIALKFYTSMEKVLKLKVKKLLGLIVTFIEVTGVYGLRFFRIAALPIWLFCITVNSCSGGSL